MTGHQNRAERRSLQVIELRRIRSEFKKRTKGLSEGDKYFYYNAKKFRKSLFYYNLKKSAVNTVEESQVTSEPSRMDLKANTNIGLPIVTATTIVCQSEPSVSTDTADTADVYQEEEGSLLSDTMVQAELNSPTYEEEIVQIDALVMLHDIDQTVESTDVSDIFNKDTSIEAHTFVAFDTVEKVTKDIHTAENPEEEDTSLTSSTSKSLTADKNIPVILTLENSFESVFIDGTPIEGNHHVSDTIVQTIDIPEETSTETESEVTKLLVSEATPIMVNKEEGTVVETTYSEFDTAIVLLDKEQEVTIKDVDIILELERFKLESEDFSSPPIPMFDDISDKVNELKARTDELMDAGNPEDTKTSYAIEEKDNDQEEEPRDDEDDWTEGRSFISSDKKNSGFSENYVKEVTWIASPPSSIASVLCEETVSLITPPQSIRDIVFKKTLPVQPSIMSRVEQAATASACPEVIFPPLTREKKKRLQNLRDKTGAVVPKIKKVWKKLFD